ncbi:MAG: hypothetical protein BWY64_01628 [bacterium ADurb.Bin363]|nr:MAG: hypothetical protein BWY64_01628 [bacterium ADurb.Bin363]
MYFKEGFMKKIQGLSLIEILISLIILSTAIMITFGVLGRGLMVIKKGENYTIAYNLAMAQFEIYKENFHMVPFFPGKPDPTEPSYMYPDRSDPRDIDQTGKFINHKVDQKDLPNAGPNNYLGGTLNGVKANDYDFYHNAPVPEGNGQTPYYDLNQDGYPNDILEPLEPQVIKGVKFIPVVEIKPWANNFNINEIKHIAVTIYWKERSAAGMETSIKHVTFEGFIARTRPDPW